MRYAEEHFRYAEKSFRYASKWFRYAENWFRYAEAALRYADTEFRYARIAFCYADEMLLCREAVRYAVSVARASRSCQSHSARARRPCYGQSITNSFAA